IWTTFSSFTYTFCAQPTAQYGQTLLATRSAVAVRATTESVCLLRTALPRPRGSLPVSCRYTGHASSQVFTPGTLTSGNASGTTTLRAFSGGPVPSGPVGQEAAHTVFLHAATDDCGTGHGGDRGDDHPAQQDGENHDRD